MRRPVFFAGAVGLGLLAAAWAAVEEPKPMTADIPWLNPQQPARPAQPAAAQSAGRTFVLGKHTIRDGEANGKQPLINLLVPHDWKKESYVHWSLKSATFPVDLGARFTAPDGVTAIELFTPAQGTFSASSMGQNGHPPPHDVVEGLLNLARSVRPGAQLQLVDKKAQPMAQEPAAAGAVYTQTGVIRVRYGQNGQPVEEEFAGTLRVQATQMGEYLSQSWFLYEGRGIKAPAGKLDEIRPLGVAVLRSAKPTPEFVRANDVAVQCVRNIIAHGRRMDEQDFANARRAQQEINDQWRRTTEERWHAQDQRAEQMRDLLGGVDRYLGRDGGEVLLPTGHHHAWENGQDLYILSTDPNYDPRPHFQGDWSRLKPKR